MLYLQVTVKSVFKDKPILSILKTFNSWKD